MTETKPLTDFLLTPREASRMLGVSIITLSMYRTRRQGPVYYKFGKAVRYPESKIYEWMANNRQDAEPIKTKENTRKEIEK